MYNSKRFSNGVQPNPKSLSYISQNECIWLYFLSGIAMTGVAYWGELRVIDGLFCVVLSATIMVFQSVTCHHYAIDNNIWNLHKSNLKKIQNLGFSA